MNTIGVSANRLEILQIAKAVAEEKAIDQSIVIEAMQEAIEKAAKAKYGQEHDIRAKIDSVTGEQTLWRIQTVVAEDRCGPRGRRRAEGRASAFRFRPCCCPDGQTGHHAEGSRCRTRAPVQ